MYSKSKIHARVLIKSYDPSDETLSNPHENGTFSSVLRHNVRCAITQGLYQTCIYHYNRVEFEIEIKSIQTFKMGWM